MRLDLVPLRQRITAVALAATLVIVTLVATGSPVAAAPAQFPESPAPVPLPPLIDEDRTTELPEVETLPDAAPPILTPEEIGFVRAYDWVPRLLHAGCYRGSGDEVRLQVLAPGNWRTLLYKPIYVDVRVSWADDQYNRMSPVDRLSGLLIGGARFPRPAGTGLVSFRMTDDYGHATEWTHIFVSAEGDCRSLPEGDLFPNLGPESDEKGK